LIIMLTIPAFIPLPEAARKYGLDEASIRALVERGKIKAAMIDDQIFIPEFAAQAQQASSEAAAQAQQAPQPSIRKEDLSEYQVFAKLIGMPIWMSEAARKYNIPQQTISRWAKAGIIKRVGNDGNKILIDAADVAYCAKIYHERNTKQGRRLFEHNGLPYKPRTRSLTA